MRNSLSRREFLQMAGATGAALAIPWQAAPLSGLTSTCASTIAKKRVYSGSRLGASFSKFIDPLPVLEAMPNTGVTNHYRISMQQFAHRFHRDLPPTLIWGYGALGFAPSIPGRTIEARVNLPVKVKWRNDLPATHLLAAAVDHTLHGAEREFPEVRAVVHLHGGATRPQSDGYPEDWYSPGGVRSDGRVGPNYRNYVYDNCQLAAALWYHDHAMGITRLNVYSGLAGLYILRDGQDTGGPPVADGARPRPGENILGLPGPAPGHGAPPYYEIPLVIQDPAFNADGSLAHPVVGVNPEVHPQWVQDFFGDVICVNGKAWPFLTVEPRRYRFRLLNICNSRILDLSLDSRQPIFQIGSDGGLLPRAVELDHLLLAPAERADIVLDFTNLGGATITLRNHGKTPFVDGEPPDPQTTGQVLQFRVDQSRRGQDHSLPPESLPLPACADLRSLLTSEMLRNPRRFYLNVIQGRNGPVMLTLSNRRWMDPITENPRVGAVEVWEIMNLANDFHPIHLHLLQFQLLNRQTFDLAAYKRH